MVSRVVQHVTQRAPHLERRPEGASVIAIGEHGPASTEVAIDSSRNSNGQALKTSPESPAVRRFGDEVDVVALNGVLAQAKAEALPPTDERPVNSKEQRAPP